jgi:hypothetical protein
MPALKHGLRTRSSRSRIALSPPHVYSIPSALPLSIPRSTGHIAQEREKALKTGAPSHVFHFFPSTQDLTHGSLDAAYYTHPG